MLYDVDFAVAGLVFLVILYIYLKVQYNQTSASIKELKRLFFCLIMADAMDILTCVTISYPKSVPLLVNNIMNILFFEFSVICIALFPKYILAVLTQEKRRDIITDKINDIILWLYAGICASSPFTHAIFYFDENSNYLHGKLYPLIFILPIYFLLYSFIRLIINKPNFTPRQYYSIIGFIVIATSGPALQMLLPGNKILDFFALGIAAFIIVSGLETPDLIKLEKTLKELEDHKVLLEKAKKKEEERNKALHEMTKSASWSLSMAPDHQLTEFFWSDEFFWMLGYEREEMKGQEDHLWGDSLHPEDAEFALAAFTKGMTGIDPYNIQYRLKDKNGVYKWYRGTGELRVFPDGSSRYLGIIQDINDEVIKQELVKERLAALEELEKSQAALKEALHKAEAADKAKSDFLANMSHEIRTPINAVLGMNELIGRESTESNIQAYSANVADAGNSLLSLINDILDFSKIEAGRMELAPFDYELSSLLREVYNMINIRCNAKGLQFKVTNNASIPNGLFGDEVRIRQIFINILNNAVKYTDQGSVTLNVDYETAEDGNIVLVASAIDTGIGIKEENLPLLFESFKRIDINHNRKIEGTGLGLNITKSFVELMGGEILVSSVYGQGSTFTVRIPQIVKNSTAIGTFDLQSNPAKKAKYTSSFTAPAARILVVDDVAINLKVIKGLLKQTKLQIDMVTSGAECLVNIATTKYDIILLDHMMPEMDGIETLRHMKEDPSHLNPDTPVIMLTANAIIGAKEEYLQSGFADYLSKPVRPEELEAMLIKYLPKEKVSLL